ncbi:MAG: GMC family oxidoreductase [Silvibacterium sp.]|nr:GMC family oxidoreductase [Silvibacterium sp.]
MLFEQPAQLLDREKNWREKNWEVCIVGTGPVGISLAMELERLGHEVLMLESGAADFDAATAADRRAEIVDPRRHAPMEIAACRALGGTSWTWGGRCVPYDDIDFMQRKFVPESDWPISHEEIRPWYRQACDYLLCGDDTFEKPLARELTHGITAGFVERWATESRVILKHRERLEKSERIKVCLNSTVVDLDLGAEGSSVQSVVVATPNGNFRIRAGQVVLATGGVETTRLLLSVQRRWPKHFGGVGGPLGRYYMGHISGKIASIVLDDPSTINDYDFILDSNGSYYRRRFMLTSEAQVQNKLLNTAFWPDNPPFYDPGHRSGVLSAVFLALAFPPTGRRLLSEGIRLAHTGPKPYPIAAHLYNAVLGAPRAALDVYGILRDRFIRKPKKPGFLVRNQGGRYALHYHAEQIPNPDSRITLSGELDRYGMPRACIDLRYVDQDGESVIDSHRVLDTGLRANKIGRLEFWYTQEKLHERVMDQAADGYHQVGTTRMGTDPARSVVDSDLRIRGVDNLYVASSSVFPTSGQANSTLLAVAFAMRLANHLTAVSGKPDYAALSVQS